MFADISNYVKSCQTCALTKINRRSKRCLLSPIEPSPVLSRFHIDLFGPLRETSEGYKYALCAIESFSRYPEVIPLKSTTGEELATALYNSIITRYGAVTSIVSDLGSNLTSRVFKCLSDIIGFKHMKTSAYKPSSNGLVEKFNQQIIQAMRLYCTQQKQWLEHIPPMLYSYRATSAVKSIKVSPFETLFGQSMKLPVDVNLIPTELFHQDVQKYVQEMILKLALTEKIIMENTRESQQKNKVIYDRKSAVPQFKVGDRCYLRNCSRKVGVTSKLQPPYLGPYRIEQAGQKNFWFRLRHCVTDELLKNPVYADRLKPYVEVDDTFYTKTMEAKQRTIEREALAQREILNKKKSKDNRPRPEASTEIANETEPTAGPSQITPAVATQAEDKIPTTSKEANEQWFPVKQVLRKRGQRSQTRYQVIWDDGKDTTSWVKPADLSEACKRDFRMAKASNKKRSRRRL